MKLVQTVPPTSEPLTLTEAKAFLRVLHSEDDAIIGSLITAAREKAETIMNRQLMPATFELYFDETRSAITLPRPPFVSLVVVAAFDGTTWNDVADYDLDDKAVPAVLHVSSWPAVSSGKNSVRVIYTSGYADASKVPESIKAWMRIELEMMYDEEKPRVNVDALLNSYRIIPL